MQLGLLLPSSTGGSLPMFCVCEREGSQGNASWMTVERKERERRDGE